MSKQNEMIKIICEIWEDLLAVEVSPEDDFFDLGGYSLLMVNVVADARKRGIEISADDIFTYKTPAAIVRARSVAGTTVDEPPATKAPDFDSVWATGAVGPHSDSPSTVVQLAEGTGTPVFCFHWGTGNVRFITEVLPSFRGDRPVYGVEAVGLWGRERPPLSLVEMAGRYLADIRTVQPTGPYLLVGPCAGGRIAYEIALMLEAAGEEVAVLAIANTMPPETTEFDAGWGLRDLYNFRVGSLRHRFDDLDADADIDQLMVAMTGIAWLDEGVDPADLYWRQAVWSAGILAQEHYQARAYAGALTVFQLTEHAHLAEAQWAPIAAQVQTHVIDAPGTLDLLRHPSFGEILGKQLAAFDG